MTIEVDLDTPLHKAGFRTQVLRVLQCEGFTTLRDLIPCTDAEFLMMPNFGRTALLEVRQKLEDAGAYKPAKRNAQIPVRVPQPLRDRLREAAESNGRSLTQEVEHRLLASFSYADAADYLRQRFG